MDEKVNGNLIIIGGAEDKYEEREILKKVASFINKEKDILLVATIATDYPKSSFSEYKKVFSKLNIKNIKELNIKNRKDAEDDKKIELINQSKLIFFTGGDQLKITSLLGGTPIYHSLKEFAKKGGLIAGTSAGASMMSENMILEGEDEESPKKCTLKMAPGLGFIKGILIDQHFAQRGRIGRLLTGVAENPEILGIGIDEDTAIVVNEKGNIEVIGNGAVYFIDGSSITYNNVSEQHCDEVLSMFNIKLHILKEGNKFDILKKSPFEEENNNNENNK